MTAKTLTRADLADAVVRKVGLPRNESQDLVELILDEISETLSSGEAVKLSSFGSFGIREKGQRIGRNPKTGKEVPITPRRVLVFRPSNVMKERINVGAKRRSAASAAGEANGAAKGQRRPQAAAQTSGKAGAAAAGKTAKPLSSIPPAKPAAAKPAKTGAKSAKAASERQA